jgi:Na+/H+ antiporter NhaD/arsenite permease-like protein
MLHAVPQDFQTLQTVAAYGIFEASYVVFALGTFPGMKIDRPGAGIIGAVLMLALGILPAQKALAAIDFSTLVLLFSMMLIVSCLHQAGFFDWVTHLIVTWLKPHQLLPTVIFTSGILSAFLVNDIICLAMVPLVLAAAKRLKVKSLPYLLAVATASNIGSVAGMTGNPQNILIGSYSGMSYLSFMAALAPVALIGLFLDWAVIHFMFMRKDTAAAADALEPLKPVDRRALVKPAAVTLCVLAGFLLGVSPALMASIGAAAMLMSRTRDPRKAYAGVDWGLLIFFTGLFLIVGGAEQAGINDRLLHLAGRWNLHQPVVFTLAVAALSNIVSNVPAVMLLKSAAASFADSHAGWLLLAMASTLAGNLTITGSVANIIVVEQARKEAPIGFMDYFKVGFPVTVLTLGAGLAWLSLIG